MDNRVQTAPGCDEAAKASFASGRTLNELQSRYMEAQQVSETQRVHDRINRLENEANLTIRFFAEKIDQLQAASERQEMSSHSLSHAIGHMTSAVQTMVEEVRKLKVSQGQLRPVTRTPPAPSGIPAETPAEAQTSNEA